MLVIHGCLFTMHSANPPLNPFLFVFVGEVLVTTIAGTGAGTETDTDGTAEVAEFTGPAGLDYLSDGTLLVIEQVPLKLRALL